MRRPRKPWLIAVAVAAIAIALLLFLSWLKQPTLPEGFASANGRLEATEVDIATKRPGRLSEIVAKEGDTVQKDQVLARMDVRDLQADLRQARAEFDEAVQAKKAATAKVAQQESAVNFAAAEFRRSESLVRKKLQSQQLADLARSKLQSEKAGLSVAHASVNQAEASIEAAQAKIDSIQTQLDDSILKSPIDGRVLYRLAEPGEVLATGGKVLTLVDMSDIYITVFLPTEQAGKVAVGSESRIVLDAMPDVALPAHISFVSPEAQFTPKEVETKNERAKLMFRVKARIDSTWLMDHGEGITTGVPGVLYVRLDPNAKWPKNLQPPSLTQKETGAWTTPLSQAN